METPTSYKELSKLICGELRHHRFSNQLRLARFLGRKQPHFSARLPHIDRWRPLGWQCAQDIDIEYIYNMRSAHLGQKRASFAALILSGGGGGSASLVLAFFHLAKPQRDVDRG